MAIEEWLSHLLVLLLIGASISSYLIPAFTRRWQDHQKELELKTSLISQISESVTGMIMSIQFAELRTTSQTQADFDKAYRESQIKSSVIGSYLRAYFPTTQIPPQYANLSFLIEAFYALTGIHEANERMTYLQNMKHKYFAESPIDWHALTDKRNPNYSNNWLQLRDKVLNQKDELIQSIIKSHISAFSSRL